MIDAENIVLREVEQEFRTWTKSAKASADSPLIICGPPGTGKSHVALGLANLWKDERSEDSVVVVSAVDFARGLNEATKSDDLARHRERFHSANLCIVEDIHHLAGKTAAQRELASVSDVRQQMHRPLILTTPNVPLGLRGLSTDLASRLTIGLCLVLKAPGEEARRFLLRKLAHHHDVSLTAPALDSLTSCLAGATVPELQASIYQLKMTGGTTGTAEILEKLQQSTPSATSQVIHQIIQLTAKNYGLKTHDLTGKSRQQSLIVPRSLAMYLARQQCNASLQAIGKKFGHRDHTTVLHACRKAEKLISTDQTFRAVAEGIKLQLQRKRLKPNHEVQASN